MQHRYAPLLATLVVLAVNAAASILPINGISTGELSDLYPTGFTPPGWVFSIWGLIYTGLIAYSLTALRGNSRARQRAAVIQGPYLLNAIGNAGWIFAWHYREVELSVLLMLFILATLIVIFLRLRRLPNSTWGEYFTIDAPFSLYFGWITAATLINIATLFFDWGRYPLGLSMDEWALATVTFAIASYVWLTSLTRDVVYGAVLVWAGTGIYFGAETVSAPVRIIALTGVIALATAIVWVLFNPRPRASLRGP
ncbi:MAG: tryptophan-rich sensory protein [Steroidobacteraceae bacterium]